MTSAGQGNNQELQNQELQNQELLKQQGQINGSVSNNKIVTESDLFSLPSTAHRQNYRNWKVTIPMYGASTGLTIIYQGDQGANIYINGKNLINVSTLVMNSSSGKASFKFQEISQTSLSKSITYQKQRSPDGELKTTLKFLRVNYEKNTVLVYQKVYRISTDSKGIVEIKDLLEQTGVLMSRDVFLDPYFHIVDSNQRYNVSYETNNVSDDI